MMPNDLHSALLEARAEHRFQRAMREREAKQAREARPEVTVTVVPKTGLRRDSNARRSTPEPTKPEEGGLTLTAEEVKALDHMIRTHPQYGRLR
jgi:hypothetical protein